MTAIVMVTWLHLHQGAMGTPAASAGAASAAGVAAATDVPRRIRERSAEPDAAASRAAAGQHGAARRSRAADRGQRRAGASERGCCPRVTGPTYGDGGVINVAVKVPGCFRRQGEAFAIHLYEAGERFVHAHELEPSSKWLYFEFVGLNCAQAPFTLRTVYHRGCSFRTSVSGTCRN